MGVKEALRELCDTFPKSNREILEEAREELRLLLGRGASIRKLFPIAKEAGFRGDIRKFTETLQDMGLWIINSGSVYIAGKPKDAMNVKAANTPSIEKEPARIKRRPCRLARRRFAD